MTFLCVYIYIYNTIVLQFLDIHCEPITIQIVFHTKPYQKLWMHQVTVNIQLDPHFQYSIPFNVDDKLLISMFTCDQNGYFMKEKKYIVQKMN